MKKSFLTAAAFIAAAALTGCSAGAGAKNVNEKVPEEKQESQKEIDIWTRGSETDAVAELLRQAVSGYSEETGVKVNLQFIAFPDVVTKWNSAFASGTAPDIIDLGIGNIAERVNLGHLIPLDSYYESWEGKDDFIPAMKDLGSYQDKLYGISHRPDPQVFVYRKDLFEEAGLDASRPPKDWNEMLQYAEKLTIKDKDGNVERAGFAMPTKDARVLANSFIHQNGARLVDESANLPLFDQPEALELVQYMNQLHNLSTIFENDNWSENPILKGSAAMGYLPNKNFAQYIKENPDMEDKFGVAACVPNKEPATWCGVWLYGITSQSKDPDLAFDLISYLTSRDVLSKRMEETGIPTPYLSTAEAYIEMDPVLNQAVADAIECGYGNPKVTWSKVYEDTLDEMLEQVFYGVKTPEEALAAAQEKLLKETK